MWDPNPFSLYRIPPLQGTSGIRDRKQKSLLGGSRLLALIIFNLPTVSLVLIATAVELQKTFQLIGGGQDVRIDLTRPLKHHFLMSRLAEIEKAVEALSVQEKQALMRSLRVQMHAQTNGNGPRALPPVERAMDLKRWAASHETGPGLPDSAVGRDAIYD